MKKQILSGDSCFKSRHVGPDDVTRRSALAKLLVGGAAGAVAAATGPWTASGSGAFQFQSATVRQWEQLVGTRFQVGPPAYQAAKGEGANLTLQQVIENKWIARKSRHRTTRFNQPSISLLFSADRAIDNVSFHVRHPQIGTAVCFLNQVPRDEFAGKLIYEAVINQTN